MKVKISLTDKLVNVPHYMSEGASGCDIRARLGEPVMLKPLDRASIPTGICVEVPLGFEVQVRSRSGLSLKEGLTVVNAPGTIDSDYRGEVRILVVNLGDKNVIIQDGMRLAQLVLCPVHRIEWEVCASLESSERGTGGFGSTGNV